MIKDNRVDELHSMINNPLDIIKYSLNTITSNYNLLNAIEKTKALKECVDYLRTLNPIISNEYKGYLANLLNIKSYHIVLGQTDISNNEINIKSELTKADEKFLKTLIEKPDYMDILFGNVDYEAFDNKYFRAFFENENEDILRSIKIRDDIVIYNEHNILSRINHFYLKVVKCLKFSVVQYFAYCLLVAQIKSQKSL